MLGVSSMGKGSKGNCKSATHKNFKDKAKNRVDDLQGMFTDLQFARKESRAVDVTVLEEQVHQMLREWKAELNEPSPASSLQILILYSNFDFISGTNPHPVTTSCGKMTSTGEFLEGSLGSFSSDLCRLLQHYEEDDDATSKLAAPKSDPEAQNLQVGDNVAFQGDISANPVVPEHGFSGSGAENITINNMDGAMPNNFSNQLDSYQFNLQPDCEQNYFPDFDGTGLFGSDAMLDNLSFLPNICPPPSAFLGPKCALWDCTRPVQGERCRDYCSDLHAVLASAEGPPGMTPVLRPRGIGLKDGLLFAALSGKVQGKDVGIPECEGAATKQSPWNATIFDTQLLEGETIREWLFFDKPRRAFDSGNRKQRSLPDYSGRGWHESRKQVMNELGGQKRSYYMDPQPWKHLEWHLFEYEINECDACALYRLELKQVDAKKSPKGKVTTDSVADLQQQMGRLTAEGTPDSNNKSRSGKGRSRGAKDSTQVTPPSNEKSLGSGAMNSYFVENLSEYYLN